MARNEEKAQTMLNRYLASREGEVIAPKKKRPYLASECKDLNEADSWRAQILREIGRKVLEIQNAGLGEHKIRDLNDEINKLIREKGHWERRIVELGGPDYGKIAPKITDSKGRAVAEARSKGAGYRYFGAAKNLPGVKELFESIEPKKARVTRGDLYKRIDGDYYGFRDEDDGVLVGEEEKAEADIRRKVLKKWEEEESARAVEEEEGEMRKRRRAEEEAAVDTSYVAYVPLPEQAEIEKRVLKSKKEALMNKYASEDLLKEQEHARQLLQK